MHAPTIDRYARVLRSVVVTPPARTAVRPPRALASMPFTLSRACRSLRLGRGVRLGCARIDLRLSETAGVYVIEANPNPQLSYDEDFAQSAKKAGISYGELLQRILNLGLRWEPTRLG